MVVSTLVVTKFNFQGQKDLPAAFDKQDKDQFVADCKEVCRFFVGLTSIHEVHCLFFFSVLEHRFRELQEDLLVLLEVLPGLRAVLTVQYKPCAFQFKTCLRKSCFQTSIDRQPTQTGTIKFRALSSRR